MCVCVWEHNGVFKKSCISFIAWKIHIHLINTSACFLVWMAACSYSFCLLKQKRPWVLNILCRMLPFCSESWALPFFMHGETTSAVFRRSFPIPLLAQRGNRELLTANYAEFFSCDCISAIQGFPDFSMILLTGAVMPFLPQTKVSQLYLLHWNILIDIQIPLSDTNE